MTSMFADQPNLRLKLATALRETVLKPCFYVMFSPWFVVFFG